MGWFMPIPSDKQSYAYLPRGTVEFVTPLVTCINFTYFEPSVRET